MGPPQEKPSLLLRFTCAFSGFIFWLLATLWFFTIISWCGIYYYVLPRIDSYRPWIAQFASHELGCRVEIGSIQVIRNGLLPHLEVKNITLFDKQGNSALNLSKIMLTISPRSAFGLKAEQLYIEKPDLFIKRTPDGQFWVAGIPISMPDGATSPIANWIFSQHQIQIRQGTLHWLDEVKKTPLLTINDVNLLLNNSLLTHNFRLDVAPPSNWGGHLSLIGKLRQPLLEQSGDWKHWSGLIYARAPAINLAPINTYLPSFSHFSINEGSGEFNTWVSMDAGHIKTITADVAARHLVVSTGDKYNPLTLAWMNGRFSLNHTEKSTAYETQGLRFALSDNTVWPGGNVRLTIHGKTDQKAKAYGLEGENLDLTAMSHIAEKLLLADKDKNLLMKLNPHGLINTFKGKWEDGASPIFSAQGSISKLSIAPNQSNDLWTPGANNVDLQFDFNQNRGSAAIQIAHGAISIPSYFAAPSFPLSKFTGDFEWNNTPKNTVIAGQNIVIDNPDIKNARMRFSWKKEAATPAHFQLQGDVSQFNLVSLPTYLPLSMPKDGRSYLKSLLISGTAKNTTVKLDGDLDKFPYESPKDGSFSIDGTVQKARLRYMSNSEEDLKNGTDWPVIAVNDANVLLNGNHLTVSNIKGHVDQWPKLDVSGSNVNIFDLYGNNTTAVVGIHANGPLNTMLGMINQSPISSLTNHVLANTTGSGIAPYTAKLTVPINHPEKATITASVNLNNAALQFSNDVPRANNLSGQILFNEKSLWVERLQGKALGGPIKITGGLNFSDKSPKVSENQLLIRGVASAQSLQKTSALGIWSGVMQYALGSTPYSVKIGIEQGSPTIQINSSLNGLGLTLPAPFTKLMDETLPLQIRIYPVKLKSSTQKTANLTPPSNTPPTHLASQDTINVSIGKILYADFLRTENPNGGSVIDKGIVNIAANVTDLPPALPASGVTVHLALDKVDADDWSDVMTQATKAITQPAALLTPATTTAQPTSFAPITRTPSPTPTPTPKDANFLPNRIFIDVNQLNLADRTIHQVKFNGTREGMSWLGAIRSKEANGTIEYHQGSSAQTSKIKARLSNLTLGPSDAHQVENLLSEQTAALPAMDIVIDKFSLRGKDLGKLEVEAINKKTATETQWQLHNLTLTTPEATLRTTGNWLLDTTKDQKIKRTHMKFDLSINNAGDLLKRFNMPGVVNRGHGDIKGDISWQGSPLDFNFPTMNGAFNVNIESGQFLKADPGLAKLLGILSLQALPRRFTLDFRDMFSQGFSFDFFRGDVSISSGMASTKNLQMKGVNAVVMMDGTADLSKETQSIRVLVIPEISTGTAALITSFINPVVGLSTFLAQLVLSHTLSKATTQEFQIDGTWTKPIMNKIESSD